MFHIKNMVAEDFPFAVHLTDTMNWKLTEEDFEFMLKLEPLGCFVLFHDLRRAGIVTTITFDEIGWLGNLIVAGNHRKRGAGSLLAKQAVNYLKSKGVKTIGLYAYIDKIPFYKRLGFEYESEFIVLRGTGFSSPPRTNVRKAKKQDLQKIINFDKTCFGGSRRKLLVPILLNSKNPSCVCDEDGKMLGYAVAKVYEDMAELGPLVCTHGRPDVAIDLLNVNLERLEDLEVSSCVPKKESEILKMLMETGFTENFRVARMFFKPQTVKDCVYIAESLERG